MSEPATGPDSREFARVDVRLRVRCRVLDDSDFATLRERIGAIPTVWAPRSEATLRELATNQNSARDGVLAQAILDIADRLMRLESALAAEAEGTGGWVVQLSGGGGRLEFGAELAAGTRLLLTFEGEDDAPRSEPSRKSCT